MSPRTASADQVADLTVQATAISQKLVQDQLQIDADQLQYSVVSERVPADAAAMEQMAQEMWQDEQQIAQRTRILRAQSIRAYMSAGTDFASPEVALFTGQEESKQAAIEYTDIAVGNVSTALASLRSARRSLEVDQAKWNQRLVQDQADQSQQATDLIAAKHTEHQMELLQTRVTGQLALAVQARTAGQTAAASWPGSDPALPPFLQCALQAESGGNYGAVSPSGRYMGGFQFSQSTWNEAATAASRPDLVGVRPNLASKADQDTLAVTLYSLDGQQPWFNRCRS